MTRYGLGDGLKYCVQHGLSCLINIVDPCDQQANPAFELDRESRVAEVELVTVGLRKLNS